MEEKLFLFRKSNKKGDKKWDSYFATTEDNSHSITVTLTDDAKTEILKSGIDFPLAITISDDDYFIAKEKYDDANGITLFATKCVIQSFTKIEKADIKKQTLRDVWEA